MSETKPEPFRGLFRQLDHVGSMIDGTSYPLELRRPQLSGWSVGEHADHILKVKTAIFRTLVSPAAKPLEKPITLLGRVVLTTGYIPRGKGRSPEPLRGAQATAAELTQALGDCRDALDAVNRSPGLLSSPQLLMRHPVFRGLTARQALRFAHVHTAHHFAIVRDIARG